MDEAPVITKKGRLKATLSGLLNCCRLGGISNSHDRQTLGLGFLPEVQRNTISAEEDNSGRCELIVQHLIVTVVLSH